MSLVAVFLAALPWQVLALQVTPSFRLDLDRAFHDSDTRALPDNALLRRAELGVDVKFNETLAFKTTYDFAGGGKYNDAVLTYQGWKAGDLAVGQFKVPFSLDNMTSSKYVMAIERALPVTAFAPPRHVGIGFNRNREHYTFSVMGFGRSLAGDEGTGVGARYTFAPIDSGSTLLHLGVAFASEDPHGSVRFKSRPESKPTDADFVDTGKLDDVGRINRLGLETAYRTGPFTAQMEWIRTAIMRRSNPDATFDAWYIEGSWMLRGGSRRYEYGKFKSPALGKPYGTWELTARYSHVGLNNSSVQGGRENNLTLGLNWNLNNHGRIMLNYIRVHSDRRGISDNPNILLVQTQFYF